MAEKTVSINGQDVKFKITGFTPIDYSELFGKDFFADFTKIEKEVNEGAITDSMPFYRMAYALAKKADDTIPSLQEWYESFEDGFPLFDLINELFPLIALNIVTQKKPTLKKK